MTDPQDQFIPPKPNRRSVTLLAFLTAGFLGVSAVPLRAQSFFTSPTATFLTPSWRNTAGTEFSHWDVFYSAFGDPTVPGDGLNYPDFAAPNGSGNFASATGALVPANANPSDPFAFWHVDNPTLRQTLTNSAFIIGAGTAGNIYSFAEATGYELADTTPYTAGTVMMQWQTDGQLMDFSTLRLVANGTEYAPTNFITEYRSSGSSFGGITNRTGAQWDLTGLGITDYTIKFESSGSSNSFQELRLDTAPTYVEAVPSARTRTAATGLWSAAASWSPAAAPVTGGNIAITSGTSLTVDGGVREIGELKLSAPGGFTFGASGGGVLKINSGITATPATATNYTFNTPVQLGSYNLDALNAATTIDFNSPVSGSTGVYVSGGGRMRFNTNNTFTGSLTLDGATIEMAGSNAYTGATTIFAGSLVLKTNAPAGSAGALGNSSGAVNVGGGGAPDDPGAALIIDGAFTVARNITLAAGGDPKKLGGRNTGAGAAYSGNLALNSAASEVRLDAEGAGDRVTFSGAITGGAASPGLSKTGAGRVIFTGAAKTYLNDTTVKSGVLQFAAGSGYNGAGAVIVESGATLLVHGSLSGVGGLLLTGGTLGGNGVINRPVSLDDGDTLAPGASVGTITTGAETWGGRRTSGPRIAKCDGSRRYELGPGEYLRSALDRGGQCGSLYPFPQHPRERYAGIAGRLQRGCALCLEIRRQHRGQCRHLGL
jgi:autotransporter-associated beta strand protein